MALRTICLMDTPTEHEFCEECDTVLDGREWYVEIQHNGNAPRRATHNVLCEECADKAADEFGDRSHRIWGWYADQFDNGEVHS